MSPLRNHNNLNCDLSIVNFDNDNLNCDLPIVIMNQNQVEEVVSEFSINTPTLLTRLLIIVIMMILVIVAIIVIIMIETLTILMIANNGDPAI